MGLHSPFEDLNIILWLKELLNAKLPIAKTNKIKIKWAFIEMFTMPSENSLQGL